MAADLLAQTQLWLAGRGDGSTPAQALIQTIDLDKATVIDGSVQISTGGDLTLFAGAVPPHGYLVQNNTSAVLWIEDTGAEAVANRSLQLAPNGAVFVTPDRYVPSGAVHILGGASGGWVRARYW